MDILSASDRHKTTFSLELEANKRKIAKLKQKRQKFESKNKNLNVLGKKHQNRKQSQKVIEIMQLEIRNIKKRNKLLNTFLYVQQENVRRFQQLYAEKTDTFLRGLFTERIQKFAQFTADESHVGDQCSICMENFEIGRNMMRLDCDGKHAFCQVCIKGWFVDHKTCPICRHKFNSILI